jgi:hypothetical protein
MMATQSTSRKSSPLAAYLSLGLTGLMGVILVIVAVCAGLRPLSVPTATAQSHRSVPSKLALIILAQKPGSSMQGPAYSNTNLVLPAHTLVTLTIVNQDPGDTTLVPPFGNVTGTAGGLAYVDGQPYSALDVTKVAHTFTISKLGVNVPIPGDPPKGHSDISVTFSFMTGNAGTYAWQCMDPCGAGPSGWGGPMATSGFMKGTLTVVA